MENDFACKDFDEVREFVKVKDFFAQKGIHSGSCSRVRDLIYSWLKSKSSKFVRIEKTVIYDSSKVDVKFISSMAQFSKIVKELKIERDCMFFRGQSILNREEKTSLVRSNPEYEVQFYDEIINLYPEEFCNENTYFDKLSKMQHYGIPTRLLDITKNPYIALYFACEKHFNEYGVIRIYLTTIDKIKNNDDVELNQNLEEVLRKVSPLGQQSKKFEDCIVRPKLNNMRIRNQQGLFICSGNVESEELGENFVYKRENNKKLVLLIPGDRKKEILSELDTFGISSDFIYPELEKSAEYLKSKYKR